MAGGAGFDRSCTYSLRAPTSNSTSHARDATPCAHDRRSEASPSIYVLSSLPRWCRSLPETLRSRPLAQQLVATTRDEEGRGGGEAAATTDPIATTHDDATRHAHIAQNALEHTRGGSRYARTLKGGVDTRTPVSPPSSNPSLPGRSPPPLSTGLWSACNLQSRQTRHRKGQHRSSSLWPP